MLLNTSLNPFLKRQEIVAIVQDHPYISFETIARRFPTIPRRTLAYDVAQLVKQHRIIKHGVTRGACYSAPQTQHATASDLGLAMEKAMA